MSTSKDAENLETAKNDFQYYQEKEEVLNAKLKSQENEIEKLTIEKRTFEMNLARLKRENCSLEREYMDLHLKIHQSKDNKFKHKLRELQLDTLMERYSESITDESGDTAIKHNESNIQNLEIQKLDLIKSIENNKAEIDRKINKSTHN